MRWKGRRTSENVEDRRGGGMGRVAIGGGGAIVVVILALLFGVDPNALFQQLGETGPSGEVAPPANPAEEELKEFVAVVLAETESVWREEFRRRGRTYEEPTLVLFTNRVESACGSASAASGPFYCPGDRRLYIDLGFYETLRERLGAPGDFAQAYVVAHEVGHHVQNLLGISDRVHEARSRTSEAEYNRLSVRLELQADFLAGVWAHHTQKNEQLLEEGDIEEALAAASAIGDDRLQMESRGTIVPDSFTHGTSEQRMRWFMLGYRTGDLERGDTFAAGAL
ncbi:MAG TPA: neutral zinc metallopeptidase [Candidatus Eisenbacteria bacterium]|nr:neutral zinc metallopeptidase [Candidatus Eisenbacteria bacterium]